MKLKSADGKASHIALLAGLIFSSTSVEAQTGYQVKELDHLPQLSIDNKQVSVSGISSGAFMASQLHVAFSQQLMGAGMVAGGPFLCAGTQFTDSSYFTVAGELTGAMKAMSTCMNPCMMWDISAQINPFINPAICRAFVPSGLKPNVNNSIEAAKTNPNVDNIDNLKDDNVYIFTGKADFVVATDVAAAASDFYTQVGVNHVAFSSDQVDAGHSFVTNNTGHTDCPKTAVPFINTCKNVDQALDLLSTIYGDMKAPISNPAQQGQLYSFDQSRYFQKRFKTGMIDTGYVYVPNSCTGTDAQCSLHIALHGCMQSEDVIGTQFVEQAGYNEVAANNDMVVLYPQAKTFSMMPLNPMGCWDFWGYTGKNYFNKKGLQMDAIMDMAEDVSGQGQTIAAN